MKTERAIAVVALGALASWFSVGAEPPMISGFDGQHDSMVFSLSFSKDNKTIASLGITRPGHSLRVWDIATSRKEHEVIFEPRAGARSVAALCPVFDRNGIVYISHQLPRQKNVGGDVRRWNTTKSVDELLTRCRTGEQCVGLWRERVLFHDEIRHTLRIYDIANGKDKTHQAYLPFHVAACSSGGKGAVLVHKNNVLSIVDLDRCEEVADFAVGPAPLQACALSPDLQSLAIVHKGVPENQQVVHIWNVSQGTHRRSWRAGVLVNEVLFAKAGRLLVGMAPASVVFLDLKTDQALPPMIYGSMDLRCIRFGPDDKTYATGDNRGLVRLFRTPAFRD